MDKMLVRYILLVCGIVVGSNSLRINADFSSSKNDSDKLFNFKPVPVTKPKRQLDNFDFDLGSFEGSSFFKTDKTDDITPLDLGTEDFSGFLPTVPKVTRSNLHDLGIHGSDFDTSSLSSENYQADSQVPQRNAEVNVDYYSNEDQSALSQSQLSTVNNPGPTPRYSNISNQPTFIPVKATSIFTDPKHIPTLPYNTYSPVTEYASGSRAYTTTSQLPIQMVSPGHSITYAMPYKNPYPQQSRTYAPLHNHNNQQQQQYGVPYQNMYNNIHLTTTPTVDINGRKLSLPFLQLQTEVPNYVQAVKTQPGIGVSFDFAKPKSNYQRLGTNTPFTVTKNPRTTQLLPLQTSSSTPQFPQYKGASVSQFPHRGFKIIPNDYQEFKLQPQLHFSKNANNKNNDYHGFKDYKKPGVYTSQSEKIKSDVEIIDKKKKKPPPPPKNDDDDEKDEDNSDEDYSGKGSYAPKEEEDDKSSRKSFKESELEGDFIPSKSYPFKEYDQKFKKSIKTSFDRDDDDNDDSKANFASKSNDDDDDDDADDNESKYENESSEDESKSKYSSSPVHDSYSNQYQDDNDDEEEETNVKHKKNYLKSSERNNSSKKTQLSRKEREPYTQVKYEKPHGEKYQKSTEIDVNHSKSRPNQLKSGDYMKNKHRAYRDESGEPSTRKIPSSILQNNSNGNSWFYEKNNNPSKVKNTNSELPSTTWKTSFGRRFNEPDDDNNKSSYSQEEAAAMRKHTRSPLLTTHEYTTRPAHKTSTTFSKGLANQYPLKPHVTPIRRRSAQNKEDKQKFISSTHNKPSSTGVKAFPYSKEKTFNFDFN